MYSFNSAIDGKKTPETFLKNIKIQPAELHLSSRTGCVAATTESHQSTRPVPAPPLTAGLCLPLQSVTAVGRVVVLLVEGVLKQAEDDSNEKKLTYLIVVFEPHIRSTCEARVQMKYPGALRLLGQPPPLPG